MKRLEIFDHRSGLIPDRGVFDYHMTVQVGGCSKQLADYLYRDIRMVLFQQLHQQLRFELVTWVGTGK